jgi:hypothetical protein
VASTKFKFNRSFYEWRQTLHSWQLRRPGGAVTEVVPDSRYPSMYRVKLPDGSISDMINLTRAKDAALSLADARLDGRIRGFQAPRIARSTGAAPGAGLRPKRMAHLP